MPKTTDLRRGAPRSAPAARDTAAPGRLRIALLCHASIGGSTRVAVELANALARRHEVHLLTLSPLARTHHVAPGVHRHVAIPDAAPRPSTSLHTQWTAVERAAFIGLLERLHRTAPLDIVHAHYAAPFASVLEQWRQARPRRAPVPARVVTVHGTDTSALERGSPAARELRHDLRTVTLTTVSHAHAALSSERLSLREPPVVIPNFIDTRIYRPRPDEVHDGPLQIVHVSNFRPVKNLQLVAEAFAALAARRDVQLALVGDGETLPETRDWLESQPHARGRVRYLGVRADLHALLPTMDVMLLGSRAESFSLVALEAMACGVPVVGPAVGGLSEVVWHGYTGRLFAANDVTDAVQQLHWLTASPARLRGYGRTAEVRAARFDTRVVTGRYDALYCNAIGSRDESATSALAKLPSQLIAALEMRLGVSSTQ